MSGNKVADPGNVFVCSICGKMSNDLYGQEPVSPGWDESCMLHAVELPKKNLIIVNGLVRKLVSENETEENPNMEKYGVQTEPDRDKIASSDTIRNCRDCGAELEKSGGVYINKCPNCGTKPFEVKNP